jgi:hypothetical protein
MENPDWRDVHGKVVHRRLEWLEERGAPGRRGQRSHYHRRVMHWRFDHRRRMDYRRSTRRMMKWRLDYRWRMEHRGRMMQRRFHYWWRMEHRRPTGRWTDRRRGFRRRR